MFEELAARVNSDAALVQRGRFVNTTFLLAVDDVDHLVRIVEGKVVSIKPGPFVMPDYSFALRASREAWEKFFSPNPQPGFTDIFALVKQKVLSIEGDLHPFMSNLLYFKGVLMSARSAAVSKGASA